jgi:hypothetical protein
LTRRPGLYFGGRLVGRLSGAAGAAAVQAAAVGAWATATTTSGSARGLGRQTRGPLLEGEAEAAAELQATGSRGSTAACPARAAC